MRIARLKHLHDAVLRKIDASNRSFWAACHSAGSEGPQLGLLERQRLKPWLAHSSAEIGGAGL